MKNFFDKKTWVGIIMLVGVPFYATHAQTQHPSKKFTVVIDPGHGGKDAGTLGTGRTKIHEKDVVLAIGKKVDSILKKNDPDIRVIMTRKTDKFVELRKRADIANKAKADVFVSIHCNANPNKNVRGSETYVLGIHRNKDNLEVAKKENAVIKLEDDYKLHYKGFDPDAPETFIGLELMQEEYLEQSILLAALVQKEYQKSVHTKNRSVQQAGFAVLRLTYMPSILTEVGFLSNPQEEKFLHSQAGQLKIANSIANAVIKYKKLILQNTETAGDLSISAGSVENTGSVGAKDDAGTAHTATGNTHNGSQGGQNASKDKKADEITDAGGDTGEVSNVKCANCFFSVQLAMSRHKISNVSSYFKGLNPVFYKKMGKVYKYFYGKTLNFDKVKKLQRQARQKGFHDAFIVGFRDGNRVPAGSILKK